ncbi:polygalacturonase QRT2-like [Benincasa hispida]|uniref:polygalacturonase QRT2-like n=1 Tax=Benincasa hispida TaxID=102211 RepID=UPI0018FFBE45|nr:polygalacturonase QRT2-like [Benincasa hispida]
MMCCQLFSHRCCLLLLSFLITMAISEFFSTCSGSYADIDPPPSISSGDKEDHDQHYYEYSSEFSSMLRTRLEKMAPSPVASSEIFNVDDYGAMGDGEDDSEAFKEAWKDACSSTNAIFLVPCDRIYHLKPITFSGPCNSPLLFKIEGTIKASPHISDYEKDRRHWIIFQNISNFRVEGKGIINGNGRKWWSNSCKVNKTLPCKEAPTAVTFYECTNLRVEGIRFRNAQRMHLSFQKCNNVKALNLWIYAPGNSPNTDGIHVTGTQSIVIKNCLIMTGDDCISIVSGSKNVRAKGITCGPGHGISIGSLGAGKSEAEVSNVVVDTAKFSGTSNGVRIKTWQGGKGYAQNIIFQNIVMDNVTNPIIIDQNYCDQKEPCTQQADAVQVSNVMYQNIRGTSASEVAVKFDCSKSFPCQGILLQDINLVRKGKNDDKSTQAEASCKNVKLKNRGRVSPQCAGR